MSRDGSLSWQLRSRLLEELPLAELWHTSPHRRRMELEAALTRRLEGGEILLPLGERQHLIREVLQETVGYGPLEPLLSDPEISEIMVNGPERVFVERDGRLQAVEGCRFRDEAHLRAVLDRILAPLGRRLDEASPAVDARLPDGSRIHAILPPLARQGPVLTVRRFPAHPLGLADLLRRGSLSERGRGQLMAAIRARDTILISGGTGAGKTTLLNALIAEIPPEERVLVIEDTSELHSQHPHCVRLECRPPNLEGRGEVNLRELLRQSLRMRPDRVIVGEIRGSEALDLLRALNTGHRGSLCTLHANSAEDALHRLELLCLMSGPESPPLWALRSYISRAIQLVAHLGRDMEGQRRLMELVRVRSDGERYVLEAVEH